MRWPAFDPGPHDQGTGTGRRLVEVDHHVVLWSRRVLLGVDGEHAHASGRHHVAASGDPHDAQKFAPSGFRCPQLVQYTPVTTPAAQPSMSARYAGASSSPSTSAASATSMTHSQPSPYGSPLRRSGWSASASLISTTVPAIGA